jgi:hypothetical protein
MEGLVEGRFLVGNLRGRRKKYVQRENPPK